jgi:hypothetical protein
MKATKTPSRRSKRATSPSATHASLPLSLEEIVDLVSRHLALIHASCQADEDIVFVDRDVVMGAISQAALDASRALEPLRHVPGEIANWTPPAKEGGAR